MRSLKAAVKHQLVARPELQQFLADIGSLTAMAATGLAQIIDRVERKK